MKYTLIFSIAFLFSIQSSGQSDLAMKLDSLLATETGNHTPGCAIAVVKDGKTVFNRGYGMANLENSVPFTPATVSDIGSVAKQFTAYAIVLLEARGKLSFDDNIQKHLPWAPDLGHKITIRNLIHHTSGIREVYSILGLQGSRGGDGIEQKDARMVLENSKELNFPPGDRYMYCNTAYILLADIVSAVSGMPYEEFMRENIFRPLGMDQSYIMDIQGEVFPNCASSYKKLEDGTYALMFDNSTAYGQGGMYMNMSDMIKWINNYFDPVAGNQKTIRQMYQFGVLNNSDTLDYAFGLRLRNYRGLSRIGHTGSSAGYRTALDFFPEHGLGVIIKTNAPTINRGAILDLVLETELGAFLKEMPESIEEAEDAEEEKYEPGKGELDSVVGPYFCPEYQTTFDVQMRDGELVLIHRKHPATLLTPVGKNKYRGEGNGNALLVFEENKDGEVVGLRMSGGRILNIWFEKR